MMYVKEQLTNFTQNFNKNRMEFLNDYFEMHCGESDNTLRETDYWEAISMEEDFRSPRLTGSDFKWVFSVFHFCG